MIRYIPLLAVLFLTACAKAPAPVVEAPRKVVKEYRPIVSHPYKRPEVHFFTYPVNVDTLLPWQVRHVQILGRWSVSTKTPIHFIGYADTLGSDSANLALSTRRACNAAALIPGATCEGKGETQEFGTDADNRRVTIKGE